MTTTTATSARSRRGDALVANSVALILGTAAFSVSFTHVVHVAQAHGQGGWVAKAIATSVELMALASVAELRRRKSKGESVWIAVAVLMLGVSMSLASNLETAAAGAWGKIMAAWPALAFLAVAALVESRAGGPTAAEDSPRTDDTARTGQAGETRTEPVRPAAPAPYSVRTEPIRTHNEPTPYAPAAAPVRTEPVRTPVNQAPGTQTPAIARTHPAAELPAAYDEAGDAPGAPAVAAEPNRAQLPDAGQPQEQAPAVPSAAALAEPSLTAADTVPGASGAGAASVAEPVVADVTAPAPVLPLLSSPDTGSDTSPDTAVSALPAPAAGGAWQPGRSGLLLPAGYAPATGVDRRALLLPGHPLPAPRTGSTSPARTGAHTDEERSPYGSGAASSRAARTDQTRTQPVRAGSARTGAARTGRTGAGRTDVRVITTARPSRTEVIAELASAIRTDPAWRPDYDVLQTRTGYARSWCEKAVSEARTRAQLNAA